jgi:hypothetical protein
MRVLIGCEFSGTVRRAFRARGHEAWSCDLLPAEDGGPHLHGDVLEALQLGCWDLAILHPPCTHLCVSGARWFKHKAQQQADAIAFVEACWRAPVPRVALENPIGILPARSTLGPATQIVQPWQFGTGERKATCLWLRGLPRLVPTEIVPGRDPRVHRAAPGPDRWKVRSRTVPGIAEAMAAQWSDPDVWTLTA